MHITKEGIRDASLPKKKQKKQPIKKTIYKYNNKVKKPDNKTNQNNKSKKQSYSSSIKDCEDQHRSLTEQQEHTKGRTKTHNPLLIEM